jgi:pyridoxal phosphate enzyme (YggS family)
MVHENLPERLRSVEDRVGETCARIGRDPAEILIVAVTKGHPAGTLIAALEAGLRQIGENRVAEAMEKFSIAAGPLGSHGATRHMIGHLQRNKTRDAVTAFDWIQSVDSIRLAHALSKRMLEVGGTLPVLIEVNVGGEEQKHGFSQDEALDRAVEVAELPSISVRGLMTMAPLTSDERLLRETFRRARSLFERMTDRADPPGLEPDTLSMGMTNDYTVAIEEGSTMLRLGTALFGPPDGG